MKKQLILTAVACLVLASAFAQTRVYLLPTLHGLHKVNQRYNYDSLKATIERIRPDVVAVEIRPEDINADTAYLKKNYPYEMWMSRYWFASATIAGFDWLGEELEGKPVPDNYWKYQSMIKTLERNLHADSAFADKLKRCQPYTDARMAIMKNSTLKELYNSNDALLVKEYYDCYNLQMANTKYEELPQFYEKRNAMLQQRVSTIVQQYPDKTIVILTGDDHYPYLRDYLTRQNNKPLQP